MTEKIQARLAAVLPTLRTLAQWLGANLYHKG